MRSSANAPSARSPTSLPLPASSRGYFAAAAVVGLSDLTRGPVLPKELDGLLAWIACIADAQPVESYVQYLRAAGFRVEATEQHDEALLEMVNQIRMKLLGAEIMVGLKKLDLPGVDLSTAKQMAQAATAAIRQGTLGTRWSAARRAEGSARIVQLSPTDLPFGKRHPHDSSLNP